MPINWNPTYETIRLNKGDFIYSRSRGSLLPAGTTAEIIWANGVTWTATVEGDTVTWRIESTACGPDVIPHNTAFDMFIRYPNPDTGTHDDFHWKTGRALRTPHD